MFARGQLVEPLEIAGPQLAADAMFLAEPLTQVDQTAAFRAEWTGGHRLQPGTPKAASGTGDFRQGF